MREIGHELHSLQRFTARSAQINPKITLLLGLLRFGMYAASDKSQRMRFRKPDSLSPGSGGLGKENAWPPGKV